MDEVDLVEARGGDGEDVARGEDKVEEGGGLGVKKSESVVDDVGV